jgi:hypothetical protein
MFWLAELLEDVDQKLTSHKPFDKFSYNDVCRENFIDVFILLYDNTKQ